jgi:nickel-dependent lactate racemase
VDAPYDVVITSNSGYPLDLNLYQSVKGMSAAAQIVKKGGAIILAADCWDGIPDHGWYKKLLFEAASPASLLEKMREGDCRCQDSWQAHLHAAICQRADVYLFSHNLTDQQIEQAMLRPCRDIAATVDQLLDFYGQDASICILPEGPQTIPYVAK